MNKKDCPYCGKKEAGYTHTLKCPKKPLGEPTEAEKPIIEVVEIIPERLVEVPPPEDPEREYTVCFFCKELTAYKLNALDFRCAKCGDYCLPIQIKR
jgi:tRNA(Ile2) C34 agmatinyltransferase TiaS